MKTLRIAILFGSLIVFLYLINSGIMSAENNIKNGVIAYLELAPVDPRSLIQGDYMMLAYQIERDANADNAVLADRGQLIVALDEQGIANYAGIYTGNQELNNNDYVINYRKPDFRVDIGIDSFLFQEGQAEAFESATYAEVRILEGGGLMLINLADETLTIIDPE